MMEAMAQTLGLAAFVVLSACWRGDVPPAEHPAKPSANAAPTAALAPWRGTCVGGNWGEVEIEELSIETRGDRVIVRGILGFAQRRARATLHGRRGAVLEGSMTEIDGLGTRWELQLALGGSDQDRARGDFIEVTYTGAHTDMCSFDLRR